MACQYSVLSTQGLKDFVVIINPSRFISFTGQVANNCQAFSWLLTATTIIRFLWMYSYEYEYEYEYKYEYKYQYEYEYK